ncbi:MAG TPA: amino acid ABC transporter substrate-binding protein [Burkholderiales bacterium]|nr:amino acid ABC transporter substrate-binding protein [Burkholderiales bacterium]
MTKWISTRAALVAAALTSGAALAQPITVGAVVSQSGSHARLAEGYRQGLMLWEAEVNAAGGLLGRPVELRLRDDGSQAIRAGREYEMLVEEKVDLLVGPYGSAATLMGAAVAERAGRVMLNGAGPARTVHQRAPRYLFQAGVPYAAYGAGVLDLVKAQRLERLFLLARDDPRSLDMAEAAAELASAQGFGKPPVRAYAPGTVDFAQQIAAARAEGAEAWIAFGEAREAIGMVRTFKSTGYAPKLFFSSASDEPPFVEALGQYAEFSLGALEYEPWLATPGNEAFAQSFATRWGKRPDDAAARGYAAGTILGAAVRRAGTLEQEKLREALASLEVDTVVGAYKVDPKTGEQVALKAAVSQILFGRPTVVWPPALREAASQPYPAWEERKYIE